MFAFLKKSETEKPKNVHPFSEKIKEFENQECIFASISKNIDPINPTVSWIKQLPKMHDFVKSREDALERKILFRRQRSFSCPTSDNITAEHRKLISRVKGERLELIRTLAREMFGFSLEEFNMKMYSHFIMSHKSGIPPNELIFKKYFNSVDKLRRLPGHFYASQSISNCFLYENQKTPENVVQCCLTYHSNCSDKKQDDSISNSEVDIDEEEQKKPINQTQKLNCATKKTARKSRKKNKTQKMDNFLGTEEFKNLYKYIIDHLDVCTCPFTKDGRGEDKATLLELAFHAHHRDQASEVLKDFMRSTMDGLTPCEFRLVCIEWKEVIQVFQSYFHQTKKGGQETILKNCFKLFSCKSKDSTQIPNYPL